jgi:protein-ribulosamine 3-kinase
MMHGEYESQKALYGFVPSFIPKPINWGTYTDKRTYFFLSEFIEMTGNIPPPPKFCAKLAEKHAEILSRWKVRLSSGHLPRQYPAYQGLV